MMKSYRPYFKSHRTKVTQEKKIERCYWRLVCHKQFENSSRLGVLNDRDPYQHICIVQSDRHISKFVMGAWLQFVYVSKRTFSRNILLLEFSFPSKSSFSILPIGKQTMCRWSGKEVGWNQSWPIRRADKLSGNGLLAACLAIWEEAKHDFISLGTLDLSMGKALFCVGNWLTYASCRLIVGPVKREIFIEIKSAAGWGQRFPFT